MKARLVLLVVALALTAAASGARAKEPLGRLFFSPEERHAMNQRRNAPPKAHVDPMPQQPEDAPDIQPEPQSVMLDPPRVTGFVRRSSGNDTVWVDQQPSFVRRPASP